MDECTSVVIIDPKAQDGKSTFLNLASRWNFLEHDTTGYCKTIGSSCQFCYDTADFLEKGSFGTLYKARITERGNFSGDLTVAVKVSHLAKEAGTLTKHERWEKLGKRLAEMVELKHEHVIEYHQIKTTRTLGGVCIERMTDYYEGGNLASLLRRQWKENRVCDMPTIARYGGEIADGLAYLHAKRIVHGDLKPESVFIKHTEKNHNQLGSMIIGDLDDSKLLHFCCTRSFDLTQQDVGMRYMSPEMLMNVCHFPKPCPELQTGRKADIWSLGCIMLDLACGIPRRQIQKVADIINAEDISVYCYLKLILDGYVPHVPQSVPETLAACIRKTLRFKSTERISAAEFRDQLQSAALMSVCELASQNPLQPPRSSPKDCLMLVGPAGQ